MDRKKVLSSPYILLPVLLIMWGSFAVGSKIVQKELDVHQLQFYIFLTAFIAYSLLLLVNGRKQKATKIRPSSLPLLILCGCFAFFYFFFYNRALGLLNATEASIINYTFPVLIVLFDVMINRVKFTVFKGLSLAVGLFGTIFIITNGNITLFKLSNLEGDLYAFIGACSWALFSVLGQKIGGDIMVNNFVYMVVGLVLSFSEMMIFSSPVLPSLTILLWVIWLGSFTFAISNYIWFYAFQVLSVSIVANVSFITPLVNLVFISLFLGEKVTLVQLLGLFIIIGAVLIQRLDKKIPNTKPNI